MANLNFKWGPYSNLATVDTSAGTVYITTDEKRMYVDAITGKNADDSDKVERIRIQGSVLYYDSVDTFTSMTNPPYAQDTLYFFRKIHNNDDQATNAIMTYDGSNWIQINVIKADYDTLVTNLNTLSGSVTVLSTALTALTTRVESLETTSTTHTSQIKALQDLVGSGIAGEGNDLTARLSAVEELAATNKENIELNDGDISNLQSSVTDLTTNKANKGEVEVELAKKLDKETYTTEKEKFATKDDLSDGLNTKVSAEAYKTDKEAIEVAITNLTDNKANKGEVNTELAKKLDKDTYTTEKANFATKDALSDGLAGKVNNSTYDEYVTTTSTTITNLQNEKADKSTVNNLESTLTQKINNDIKAVNALSYKGNINSYSTLPLLKDKVKIGDMYVATVVFTIDENTSAAPGDLFIASGEEDNEGYITNSITWNQVKTGYDALLNPKLELGDNVISLFNYADTNLGSIKFITDNSNLTFTPKAETKDGVTTQTITLSHTWGTF